MKLRVLLILSAFFMIATLRAQITTVGLIGSATPGGWDVDTNMVQDAVDPNVWTIDILLIDGFAKFRANDAWDINWGSSTFPVGVGTSGGADIPITAGFHHVTFNTESGEYYFAEVGSDIGIIGSATPFGWDADINLYQDAADTNVYRLSTGLTAGAAKFRANDAWDINWGSTDFPIGIGTQGGADIPIAVGGDYNIEFNKSTGAYSFILTSFATVGLIGDATPGGWETPTMMASGTTLGGWTANVALTDGGVQFSGDNGSAVWGGSDFPSGIAELGGDTIPVPAGQYIVNFNTKTLAYEFVPIVYYNAIGIIGDATPGGWDNDTDMEVDPNDPSIWTLRLVLNDGFAKFRADDAWDVNWGASDFPTGTATQGGADIPVTAGEYVVTFNTFSGFYRFQELLIYSSVGIIGTGTEFGEWTTDVVMTKDAADENLWKLASVNLVDGAVKFRAEGAWTVNWGDDSWPTGVGVQEGANIPTVAGTYGVTLNSASGEYAFGDPLSATKDLLNPASIKAYPNPANDFLNIDLSAVDMRGDVTLTVFDVSGKAVLIEKQYSNTQLKLNVGLLQNGHYTLHISNDEYVVGKKFVIAR